MSEEKNKEATTEVVEKRVKPTLIRRRAKKVEATKEPLPSELTAEDVGEPAAEAVLETAAEVAGAEEKAAEAKLSEKPGPGLVAPSEEEKKIGVVGYIELTPTEVVAKAKEDWREKYKRAPRRRKSRAEMEMEAIQRAGGLKHYADTVGTDETVPAEAGHAFADRVFQPAYTGKRKRPARKVFKRTQVTEAKAIKKIIRIEDGISVSALSQALGVKANEIVKRLMGLEIMATLNQQIGPDTASLIAEEYGFKVEHTAFKEEDVLVEPEARVSIENLESRSPVVTVMGHVDHGKTSILDVIRKSSVAKGEAGGITQHIGAYEVKHGERKITFIDTPGHEAFTTMRARGAQVTDIVVLVVAADDGVMPQTIEAISHSKAAGVPIIVAINKIDKPDAQPDRVKQSLTEYGLVPEEWGGDLLCVNTSAKTKEGIDQLLETILLQAEMLELSADPTIRAKGIVVEASLEKGRGPVGTVLIQEGTLHVGDYIVCGTCEGKVRAMFDGGGKSIKEAGPSKPAAILGLSGVPAAGDEMIAAVDEKSVRLVAEQRRQKERERGLVRPVHVSLEDLSKQMEEDEAKELGVILKADVQGSLEAVGDSLTKLSTDQVKLKILHGAVGGITESDIMLASASDAVVFGFNVVADNKAKTAAENENIDVRTYRVIYEMIDEVRKAMEGLLAPEEKEVALGQAEVREVFKISKVGTVAGCQVVTGKIQRNAHARLIRDQVVVFEGKFASLKRFKDDVKEVADGYECGIGVDGFNDIKVGDIIEAFIIEKKQAKLT
ncbi:MAG: translation initiation factor IF-2 [Pseudomonadota bacterium]